MTRHAPDTIATGRPGGEECAPSRGRPVDLVHLARQTMGDRDLEAEVLGMFARQVDAARGRLAAAGEDERRSLAHTLKGTARSVGAFALADCAAGIEEDPSSAALLERLSALADEVRDFIAAIGR